MKLLTISEGAGWFLAADKEWAVIDGITKEDLLRLVDMTLASDVEIDAYCEAGIGNRAQQIVYKSVAQKLQELSDRRGEFVDESERLYLTEFERYTLDLSAAEDSAEAAQG